MAVHVRCTVRLRCELLITLYTGEHQQRFERQHLIGFVRHVVRIDGALFHVVVQGRLR